MQVGDKRSRDEINMDESGEAAIKKFLKSFAALPLEQMDSKGIEDQLGKLKSELEQQANQNTHLNSILVAAAAAPS